MTALEIVEKSKEFAEELRAKLTDVNEQPASKQTYFMDNYESVQKYMGALKKVIEAIQSNAEDENATVTEDDKNMLDEAQEIVNHLKSTITNFQQTLMISEDVQEENTVAALNEETMQNALKSNKTTQEIIQSMDAIAKSKQVPYNYALLCDGVINLIDAPDKKSLVKSINDIVNQGQYANVALYQLSFTPVPLKKKTVLTI